MWKKWIIGLLIVVFLAIVGRIIYTVSSISVDMDSSKQVQKESIGPAPLIQEPAVETARQQPSSTKSTPQTHQSGGVFESVDQDHALEERIRQKRAHWEKHDPEGLTWPERQQKEAKYKAMAEQQYQSQVEQKRRDPSSLAGDNPQ